MGSFQVGRSHSKPCAVLLYSWPGWHVKTIINKCMGDEWDVVEGSEMLKCQRRHFDEGEGVAPRPIPLKAAEARERTRARGGAPVSSVGCGWHSGRYFPHRTAMSESSPAKKSTRRGWLKTMVISPLSADSPSVSNRNYRRLPDDVVEPADGFDWNRLWK